MHLILAVILIFLLLGGVHVHIRHLEKLLYHVISYFMFASLLISESLVLNFWFFATTIPNFCALFMHMHKKMHDPNSSLKIHSYLPCEVPYAFTQLQM